MGGTSAWQSGSCNTGQEQASPAAPFAGNLFCFILIGVGLPQNSYALAADSSNHLMFRTAPAKIHHALLY
jgi:hypothetical protein